MSRPPAVGLSRLDRWLLFASVGAALSLIVMLLLPVGTVGTQRWIRAVYAVLLAAPLVRLVRLLWLRRAPRWEVSLAAGSVLFVALIIVGIETGALWAYLGYSAVGITGVVWMAHDSQRTGREMQAFAARIEQVRRDAGPPRP